MIEHLKLLPESYVKDIEYEFTNDYVPWYYNPSTIDCEYDQDDNLIIPSHQYTHNIYSLDGRQPSYLYQFVKPILYFLEDRLSFKIEKIIRVKANALTPLTNFKEENFNPPHYDNDNRIQDNVFSCVYYINNSDGDTRIFNKKYPEPPKDMLVSERFTPAAGHATIFNSDQWHASSNPIITDRRLVINFVFQASKFQ